MNPKRRQNIELIIITYLVTVMDERGWKVCAIADGGDEDVSPKNLKEVIDTVFSVGYSVEYSVIRFEKNGRKHAAVISLEIQAMTAFLTTAFHRQTTSGKSWTRLFIRSVNCMKRR